MPLELKRLMFFSEPRLATKMSPALFTAMPTGLSSTHAGCDECPQGEGFWMRTAGLLQEEGLQLNTWLLDCSTTSSAPLVVPTVPNAVPSPDAFVVKTWVGLNPPEGMAPVAPLITHTPVDDLPAVLKYRLPFASKLGPSGPTG